MSSSDLAEEFESKQISGSAKKADLENVDPKEHTPKSILLPSLTKESPNSASMAGKVSPIKKKKKAKTSNKGPPPPNPMKKSNGILNNVATSAHATHTEENVLTLSATQLTQLINMYTTSAMKSELENLLQEMTDEC